MRVKKKHFLVLSFLSKLYVLLVRIHSTKLSSKICKDPFFFKLETNNNNKKKAKTS